IRELWHEYKTTSQELLASPPLSKGSPHQAAFGSPEKLLRKKHTGFCLTGRRRLSRAHSHRHAILYGMTGTGKSSISLISSIFTTQGSMVVFDPGGDLYQATATAMTVYRGYFVKRLHLANPGVSDGFNPLSYYQTESEINQLAELIVSIALGKSPQSTYWNESAIDLLRLMIKLVRTREAKYHTLAHVYHLLAYLEAQPDKILALGKASHQPRLLIHLKSFLGRDSKLRSSVITTAQAALQRYSDPQIGLVSSFTSLNFRELRQRPTIIYVQVAPPDHEYYLTPHSVFWETLFAHLMKRIPDDEELPVYMLIDEAGWLSLPSLPTTMAVARKYFGLLLAIQNAEQLEAIYGPNGRASIEANAWSKLFLTAQSTKTARDLSRALGMTEVDDTVRPLLTELEIRMMSQQRGLLLCGNRRPLLVALHPYYLQPKLKRWADYSRRHQLPNLTKLPSSQMGYAA
ncbi:MAG: type IV secretory system conjugative DNA transfer family protein, partial [Bacteroidota bacterium]